MTRIYQYNLSKMIRRLTPPRWRTAFNLNWYESLLSQIDFSQNRFNVFKNQALIELSYNGQTVYLEKMLNDRFDSVSRRINIVHDLSSDYFLYLEGEGQPERYWYKEGETGMTQTFLYNEGENSSALPDNLDFMVTAPIDLISLNARMRSEINKYKLAGKVYDIVFS